MVQGYKSQQVIGVPMKDKKIQKKIVMENPNHLSDPNVPKGDQAPTTPDGFAPQWIGEHDPNNNNWWIEWDVPLGGEVDEPMVDPEVEEEVMDEPMVDLEVEEEAWNRVAEPAVAD
uniref:Uncharacterized protein n=1 Tax=Tanacetum cinerariifolium TaxID=118510 RepID=A0A699K6M2_TANCI|nr:hypothetical protein [Tanacetum cinerariifolium]